jgi:hypothetical protein
MRTQAPASALLAAVFLASACGGPQPKDPYCSVSPLAENAKAKTGKGALRVDGTASAYYYVTDTAGKSVGNNSIGKPLALDPGKYQIQVNGTRHATAVEKGSLTSCATGTLLVAGTTGDYYYVRDPAGNSLSNSSLGKRLALLPGSYVVSVNATEAKADIAAGQLTEVKTGTLSIKGQTSAYYYVQDPGGKSLANGSLNKSIALFPGSYRVQVNGSAKAIDVAAGQTSEAQTGGMLVEAAGGTYFYVEDPGGKSLAANRLSSALSLFPGEYIVKVGDSKRPVAVEAAQTAHVKF